MKSSWSFGTAPLTKNSNTPESRWELKSPKINVGSFPEVEVEELLPLALLPLPVDGVDETGK